MEMEGRAVRLLGHQLAKHAQTIVGKVLFDVDESDSIANIQVVGHLTLRALGKRQGLIEVDTVIGFEIGQIVQSGGIVWPDLKSVLVAFSSLIMTSQIVIENSQIEGRNRVRGINFLGLQVSFHSTL